jgi:hypothetical protein
MTFAWFRKPGDDAWGYYLLLVPPLERATSWLIVIVANVLPAEWLSWGAPYPSLPQGLAGFGAWGSVALLIFIISGWREPLPTVASGGLGGSV